MKLRATYIKENANPFVPRWEHFISQFRYAVTPELPDDADMAQLEQYAREKTPEGYRFVRMVKC